MLWKISHDKRILYKIQFIEYTLNNYRYSDLSYTISNVLTLMNIVTIKISLIMYK